MLQSNWKLTGFVYLMTFRSKLRPNFTVIKRRHHIFFNATTYIKTSLRTTSISDPPLWDPCVSQSTPTCLKDVLEQLLDTVVTYAEPSGRLICDLFQKLPSKMVWESSASLLQFSSQRHQWRLFDLLLIIFFSNIPIIMPSLKSRSIWKSSLKGFRFVSFL